MTSSSPTTTIINVGGAIALWLIVTTSTCMYLLPPSTSSSSTALHSNNYYLVPCLLFFNNLNIFIAMSEICLGFNIVHIQKDYLALRKQYARGTEWSACVAYLTTPLTLADLFLTSQCWLCRMWSTYSLYDPSYSNRESFGFFIDFGNGLSTIPPSLLVNAAILKPDCIMMSSYSSSYLYVGCIGLAMYWQVMYGTIIYLLSYIYNKRYVGKSLLEVCLFVGLTNGMWIIFPTLGIYACVCVLKYGNLDIFQR